MVFVAPGIAVRDAELREEVILPGSYAAGRCRAHGQLLAARQPDQQTHCRTRLKSAVRQCGIEAACAGARGCAAREARLETRMGITTSTNTAWKQITTRRIVDYAKFGVRSAADPYIGLLNNERVRGAYARYDQ